MKMKIEIKHLITGSILFEYESDNNTILKTLTEAVKNKKDLRGADLRGAYLSDYKIKNASVFSGLYDYIVIPFITDKDEKRVVMGCYNRSLYEWESDFWNNPNEFPNDGSAKSSLRLMAFNTAKEWFKIIEST